MAIPDKCPDCRASGEGDFDQEYFGDIVSCLCYVCGHHSLHDVKPKLEPRKPTKSEPVNS
jgi:hypothetical protein